MRQYEDPSVETLRERRNFERMEAGGLNVLFKGKTNQEAHGHVQDISLNGMFLETTSLEKVGDYINADIDAEDLGLIIWTQGRIVRVSQSGMGIQFTGLDEKGLMVFMHTHR